MLVVTSDFFQWVLMLLGCYDFLDFTGDVPRCGMWPTLECWCWCLTEPLARTWRLYIPSVGGRTGYQRPPGHTTAASRTQGENGHKKRGLVDCLDRRWMPSWLECVWVCLMMSDVRVFRLFRKACDVWLLACLKHTAHYGQMLSALSISGFVSNHESFLEHPVLPWPAVSPLSWPAQCQDHSLARVQAVTRPRPRVIDHFCSFCIHNTI